MAAMERAFATSEKPDRSERAARANSEGPPRVFVVQHGGGVVARAQRIHAVEHRVAVRHVRRGSRISAIYSFLAAARGP